MSFGGLILTNQGRNSIAAAISNEKALDFTHVQLGDGVYNGSYPSKKELTNMIMEIPVTRVQRRNNEVTIDCDWNSSQAPRGFYFREIGLIGNGALCYYDNAGSGEAEYIDPESETVSKEKRIRLTVVVSDDVNVTVHTASSLYALATELDELDKKKVNEEDIHDWARNPEKPTYNKEEIGLGNVDNTADKDKPLSTAMKEAIQNIYEQATAFAVAKIAELINGAPATADTLKELSDLIADNKSVVDALDAAIGKKANQLELDTHTNNSTVHITASERTKWNNVDNKLDKNYAVVATGTDLNRIVTTGLYFCNSSYTYTNMPPGVVNGYLVVMRSGTTNNIKQVFYRQGTIGTNDWQIYVRMGTTTVFGPWVRLITEKDTASASVAGLTKLYTSTGTSTDGTMTRNAITNELNKRVPKSWSKLTATGTNQINISSIVSNSSEIIVEILADIYAYSWAVVPMSLETSGKRLIDGYKTGNYEGVAEVYISNSNIFVTSCIISNVDYRNSCTLNVYYR